MIISFFCALINRILSLLSILSHNLVKRKFIVLNEYNFNREDRLVCFAMRIMLLSFRTMYALKLNTSTIEKSC